MTDDDRMDRARRIREMREGERPEDDGTETETNDDTPSSDDREGETDLGGDPTDAAETGTDDDEGGMHIPGANVGDVEVDVEEMARQAGLESAESGPDAGDVRTESPADGRATAGVESTDSDESESTMRVLEFVLGDENYCLDIEYIEEIVKQETITRVPNTPDHVEGVVDLRGQITTILDPKIPLGIEGDSDESLIVVFDPDEFDEQGAVGWIVDDVEQVMLLREREINDPPIDDEHVQGVVDRDGEFVIWTSPDIGLDEAAG